MRAHAFAVLIFSTLALATPVATGADDTGSLAVRDNNNEGSLLQARACRANGCRCQPGVPQGQYCGWGTAVINLGSGGSVDHVYECNPSGGCCDYGFRNDCA